MTTQIAVKLPDDLVSKMDDLVGQGAFPSRSAIVRRGIEAMLQGEHRRLVAEAYRRGYRAHPETAEEIDDAVRLASEAIHNEPWERWW